MQALLATYLIHSSLLLVAAWLVLRVARGIAARVWILRAAVLGAAVTSAAALAFNLGTHLHFPAPTPSQLDAIALSPLEASQAPIRSAPGGQPSAGSPLPSAAPGSDFGWKSLGLGPGQWPWLIFAISAILLARLVIRELRTRRVLKVQADLDAGIVSPALRSALGRTRLGAVQGLQMPLAIGASRIVLPARLLDAPKGEVDAVVAHELAHLARLDPLWLGLGRVMVHLAWFQPGLRWALQELERESELAADAWAIERTGQPLDLALALERIAAWVAGDHSPVIAAAMAQRESGIVQRVERLVTAPAETQLMPAKRTAALVIAGLTAFACAGPSVHDRPQAIADIVIHTSIVAEDEAPDPSIRSWTLEISVVHAGNRIERATGKPYNGEGPYAYDETRVLAYVIDGSPVADLAELESQLIALHSAEPGSRIRLHAKPGTGYQDVVHALDVCRLAGFRHVAFVQNSSYVAEVGPQLDERSHLQSKRAHILYDSSLAPDGTTEERRAVITLDADGHWIGTGDGPETPAKLLRSLSGEMRKELVDGMPENWPLCMDRLLIRAHPDAPFEAVRDLIAACADRDVAIWRIEIAPSNATSESIVPVFLPLDSMHPSYSDREGSWTYDTQPEDTFAKVYPMVAHQVAAGRTITFVAGQ